MNVNLPLGAPASKQPARGGKDMASGGGGFADVLRDPSDNRRPVAGEALARDGKQPPATLAPFVHGSAELARDAGQAAVTTMFSFQIDGDGEPADDAFDELPSDGTQHDETTTGHDAVVPSAIWALPAAAEQTPRPNLRTDAGEPAAEPAKTAGPAAGAIDQGKAAASVSADGVAMGQIVPDGPEPANVRPGQGLPAAAQTPVLPAERAADEPKKTRSDERRPPLPSVGNSTEFVSPRAPTAPSPEFRSPIAPAGDATGDVARPVKTSRDGASFITGPAAWADGSARQAAAVGRGEFQAATDRAGPRVNVLSFTSAPAPAPVPSAPLGTTPAGLVAAIEAEPTWRLAAQEANAVGPQQRPSSAAGASTLRIQLNPAELGMVTARLTATGSQLSIEIQVESNDARHRLTQDSDAIVNALRGIGFDIEKVTIQQAAPSSGQAQQGFGRDQAMAQNHQAQQGDGGARGGRDGRNGEGARNATNENAADRAGDALYI